jgi:hypothetical protein
LMVLDAATSFREVVPTDMQRNISGPKARELFESRWRCWAGPPDTLIYDAAQGHLIDDFQRFGDENSMVMRPVPAERPNSKGRIEKAIESHVRAGEPGHAALEGGLNEDCGGDDNLGLQHPLEHLRKSGLAPCQFLLGRSPRIPSSLTAALEDGRLNFRQTIMCCRTMELDERSRSGRRPSGPSTRWTTTSRRGEPWSASLARARTLA